MTRKEDDFSTDPRRWSWGKLQKEKRNGMPATRAEIERRVDEAAEDRGWTREMARRKEMMQD